MVNKKYIVFSVNFSGASEKLFSELKSLGVELEIHTIPKIWRIYFYSIISTFTFNYKKWIAKAETKYNLLQKTEWAFNRKSHWCGQILKRTDTSNYEGVIQISGTFDALAFSRTTLPLHILTDYTMRLAKEKKHQAISPLLPPSPNELDKWYIKETSLYNNATTIIVPSPYIKKSLSSYYSANEDKLISIGYGCNLQPQRNSNKKVFNKNKLQLLFVGKNFEAKGGQTILDAFKKVRTFNISAELIIVGPRTHPCSGEKGVKYLGRIYDKQKLSDIYRTSDLFIIHSFYEAFGLVLLEAMAFGIPCIGSDIDAMPDILLSTGAGKVVPLGDSEALARDIIEFSTNKDAFNLASTSGLNAINSYYNWKDVGKRFYSAITRHV